MPANVDIDDVDLNDGHNGSARVPAWEKYMRDHGATQEEISAVRRDQQRDITRARQKDVQRMTQLEQRLANVERGGVQQQPQNSGQKLPWEKDLEDAGLDKNAPELHKILNKAITSAVQATLAATQGLVDQRIAPVAQTLQNGRIMSERETLAKKFGEKRIADLWPDIQSELQAAIQRGEVVNSLEDVFRTSMPDEYRDAFFHAEQARRRAESEANKTKSDEGFITTQRAQPMAIGDQRPSGEKAVDYDKIAQESIQEALREIGYVK